MLQRIQTVYLAIALVVSLGIFVGPILTFQQAQTQILLTVFGFYAESSSVNTYPLFILSVIISFLIFFQIFSFKKRLRQIQTGKTIVLLIAVWYLILGIYIYNYFETFHIFKQMRLSFAIFIPITVAILVLIGNKYIRKDEELIRSIDRIR